jgi:3-methyladenine DNA glycosylase/8-oxoguanine DNA glycosylase
VRSIVYQQLSGKAAATIFGRVRALFPAAHFPTAAEISARSDEELRACGLSQQKLSYLRDLTARAADGRLDFARIGELADEEVIAHLSAVRGIGRWSAEMFLMFHLGRRDVWPVDDLGIRKAVMVLHQLPAMPTPRELGPIGERYRPFRSVASWYLWRLLELTPEEQQGLVEP